MVFRSYPLPVLTEPARAGADTDVRVAEEEILQGQLVKSGTAEDEAVPSDTDGERVLGVALHRAAAGDTVEVVREANAARLTSGSGTISDGDPIASHGATGEEGEVDTAAAGDFILGVAKGDDDGDGDDVIVKIAPAYGSDL